MAKEEIEIEELYEEAPEDEAYPLEVAPKERKVHADKADPYLVSLYQQWKEGDLNLQPKFQRRRVWDDAKGARLVESILLDIPIPLIYISQEKDGKWTVIDGQQRLVWLFDFLDNKYPLRGLKVYSEVNKKKFGELDKKLQRHIKSFPMRVIHILQSSNPDVKFEIFERINTGSVPLNAQELRNCLYRGPYNMFIRKLSEDQDFLYLLGLKKPHKRMVDCELVLRFFAFIHTNYQQYPGSMRRFLNDEAERWKEIDTGERRVLKEKLKKSVELTKTVFGNKAFCRFVPGNNKDPNGKWETKINKALFDIVMYGFTLFEKRDIVPRSDAVREELMWLMCHDEEFLWSVARSTDSKRSIQIHFDKWLNSLRNLLGHPVKEPRVFTHSLKKQLWEQNPVCAYEKCGQRIVLVDDAEVDHVDLYWRGGETTPSNARLVHRYCNRARVEEHDK